MAEAWVISSIFAVSTKNFKRCPFFLFGTPLVPHGGKFRQGFFMGDVIGRPYKELVDLPVGRTNKNRRFVWEDGRYFFFSYGAAYGAGAHWDGEPNGSQVPMGTSWWRPRFLLSSAFFRRQGWQIYRDFYVELPGLNRVVERI